MKSNAEVLAEYKYFINKVAGFRKCVFEEIEQRNSDHIWHRASLEDVKNVVMINSAPRAGSSLLFAILRKITQIYSLNGESVPYYKLNGFSTDFFPSDRVPDELVKSMDNNELSRDFLRDFSIVSDHDEIMHDEVLYNQYIDDLVLRFSMQWPQLSFSYGLFKDLAARAFSAYRKTNRRFSKEEFYLELFVSLRTEYETINPYYYDIPVDMVRARFPDILVPSAPPNDVLTIEEPSFILLSPGRKVDERDLREKTLLLKTPVNCYRMNYIENLFPNADIKVIYLARNPLASINGLYDGWLHRGFFSHNLRYFLSDNGSKLNQLKIGGYSDKYEWGKWWGNYDLAPGWEEYAEKNLEEVCAFQWYSANYAIQEYIQNTTCCHVKHENIVGDLNSRVAEIVKIINFLGIDKNVIEMLELEDLPVVQATSTPDPFRWKKRKDILLPFLKDQKISEMCKRLGYDKENFEEWI